MTAESYTVPYNATPPYHATPPYQDPWGVGYYTAVSHSNPGPTAPICRPFEPGGCPTDLQNRIGSPRVRLVRCQHQRD